MIGLHGHQAPQKCHIRANSSSYLYISLPLGFFECTRSDHATKTSDPANTKFPT